MEKLTLNKYNIQTAYVCYALTDLNNNVFKINVEKYADIFKIYNIPDHIEEFNLYILVENHSFVKCIDQGFKWCHDNNMLHLKPQLDLRLKELSTQSSKRKIRCIETGEEFESIASASRKKGLSNPQLSNHLKRTKGFKTVKGHTYEYM